MRLANFIQILSHSIRIGYKSNPTFYSPYKSLHFQRYVMSYFELEPPVNLGQNFYLVLHSIFVGWNEFLPTQINTVFPLIGAHALISAIHLKKGTPLGLISNKRPSRISAPSLPLIFLNFKETRNTSFYYHFIYNFLRFNFYIHTKTLVCKVNNGTTVRLITNYRFNKRKTLILTFIYVDNVAVFVFLLKT